LPPIRFTAEVSAHRDLAPDIFEKTFKIVEPAELSYTAGNYVSVKVEDGKMPPVYRAYTFASCGNDAKEFKLVVKLFRTSEDEEGRGSGFLKNLKIGDKAEFFGPAGEGSFVPKGGENDPLFLLGTGTGIAPLKALAEKLTHEKSARKITLFLGVSYPEDVFYTKEFAALQKENSNFDFKIGVSRAPDDFEGLKGRLPAILETVEIPNNLEAMVCGSETSVQGIKEKLLELGVPEDRIDAEGFGET